MSENYETIHYELADSIATITLNRPNAYNAFTEQMNKEVTSALRNAKKDRDVRSIVITGSGKAFCSGQDLLEVDEETDYAALLRDRYHPMIMEMNESPKPIIAAVNGTAAGAGMSLALAADFRIARPETKFMSAFMNVGLIPDSSLMYMLPRIVGYAKALEICTFDEPLSGERALELGLVTKLITSDWNEGIKQFAKQLAILPTKSFSLMKRYLIEGMNLSLDVALKQEAQAQRIAGMSQDHKEGLLAFSEKRKPTFLGK